MHGEGIRSPLQRVIDPLRLQLVVEVGRHGSITRAADACGIGQPTASAHLRTLETAAGQPLFVRAGRGTRLTDAGRVVAEHAAIVLSALESLHDELRAMSGAQAGTLRLAACSEFGNYVLPRVLSQFVSERERVEIRVHVAPSAEVARLVAEGEVELGVAGETRRAEGVTAERLMRDELVGIAPRGTPAFTRAGGAPATARRGRLGRGRQARRCLGCRDRVRVPARRRRRARARRPAGVRTARRVAARALAARPARRAPQALTAGARVRARAARRLRATHSKHR
jgi:molybdate transport repressor ModE-like protein